MWIAFNKFQNKFKVSGPKFYLNFVYQTNSTSLFNYSIVSIYECLNFKKNFEYIYCEYNSHTISTAHWVTLWGSACLCMHNKSPSAWLLSYIEVIQLTLKIFNMACYFLDRPYILKDMAFEIRQETVQIKIVFYHCSYD